MERASLLRKTQQREHNFNKLPKYFYNMNYSWPLLLNFGLFN